MKTQQEIIAKYKGQTAATINMSEAEAIRLFNICAKGTKYQKTETEIEAKKLCGVFSTIHCEWMMGKRK